MMKIAGSGFISQMHGSMDLDPDPDPHQNVMDPQHCQQQWEHQELKGCKQQQESKKQQWLQQKQSKDDTNSVTAHNSRNVSNNRTANTVGTEAKEGMLTKSAHTSLKQCIHSV
jgi:hypothetical protein